MNSPQNSCLYEFEGFVLDPLQRTLHTLADRQSVRLTARAFDALHLLIEHHGQLVDKDALMKALWPKVVVEENNLTQIIHALRQTLGEKPGEHRFIATAPGRGYRFVAAVREVARSTDSNSEPKIAPSNDAPGDRDNKIFDAVQNRSSIVRWVTPIAAAATVIVVVLVALAMRSSPSPAVWTSEATTFRLDQSSGAEPANNPPAVAPDGRALAWVALVDGIRFIFIRKLDSTTEIKLPGTEGAGYPFWSPDGTAIAFYADNQLKRIDLGNRSVRALADVAPVSPGGAWSPLGVIVFSSRFGLYSIPAGGGTPKLVAPLNTSRQENSLRMPQFLPDGRHFLYAARSGRPENNAAYVGSIDGDPPVFLFPVLSNVSYASPGYMLYARGRDLLARRFDPDTLKFDSDEHTIIRDGIGGTSVGMIKFFSVSTNGVLVYGDGLPGQLVTLTWMDRTGHALGTIGAPDSDYSQFRVSPDGRSVATAIADEANGTRSIWILQPEAPPRRFTFKGTHDWVPVWSPDGRRIAFSSYRDGPSNIYVKAADGSGDAEPLVVSQEQKDPGDWSPDGRSLVYRTVAVTIRARGNIVVTMLGADRSLTDITTDDAEQSDPRFSPDGRWIAYESQESGTAEIYVQPYPVTGAKWQISSGGGMQPAWRRDGRELYYVDNAGRLVAVETDPSVTAFRTGKSQALFSGVLRTAFLTGYDPAPDGSRFLVAVPTKRPSPRINVVLNWPRLLRVGMDTASSLP